LGKARRQRRQGERVDEKRKKVQLGVKTVICSTRKEESEGVRIEIRK
jgi:hypothetical protein